MREIPSEIWEAVLAQTDPEDQSSVACSLAIAFVRSRLSPSFAFQHVRLKTAQQCRRLTLRLGPRYEDGDEMAALIQTIALRALKPDPDVAVNALRLAPQARELMADCGPMWTPEQTDDLLAKPLPSLTTLELRFNPCAFRICALP